MSKKNKEQDNNEKAPDSKDRVYWIVAVVALVALVASLYLLRDLIGLGDKQTAERQITIEPHIVMTIKEAKAQLNILPGAKICADSPVFARYWGGLHVEMATSADGLKEQIKKGACDFVVIDSSWVRHNAKDLKLMVTDVDPLPGAGLVYRKYFREQDVLISIFQKGARPLVISPLVSAQNEASILLKADKARKDGYVEHSRQLYEALANAVPDHEVYHHELIKIYIIYGYFDKVSLDRAEEHLMKYAFLSPGIDTGHYNETIQTIRTLHDAQWGSE